MDDKFQQDGISYYKRGKSGLWHCSFSCLGKQYRRSTSQSERQKAIKFATGLRSSLEGGTTLTKAVKHGIVREYTRELRGERISLAKALEAYIEQPRKRKLGSRRLGQATSIWGDFCGFLGERYPKVSDVSELTLEMAKAYLHQLRTSGRYQRSAMYRRAGKDVKGAPGMKSLSPKTINEYHGTCQAVISAVQKQSGLNVNPFIEIPKLADDSTPREAFTEAQLANIATKSRDEHPMVFFIFCVGSATGLREGDICTLKWKDIDKPLEWLNVRTLKTRRTVRIPILPDLKELLEKLERPPDDADAFVYPELAAIYMKRPDLVSAMVKQFLEEGCGYVTTIVPEGRERKVSVLDVHSLRHTFCYLAGVSGVPFPIVQSVVGHMTEAMTRQYMAHATDADKVKFLAKLPSFFGAAEKKTPRDQAIEFARTLRLSKKKLAQLEELIRQI